MQAMAHPQEGGWAIFLGMITDGDQVTEIYMPQVNPQVFGGMAIQGNADLFHYLCMV
jgi:hypothetical protein